jgi:hypothetical protein
MLALALNKYKVLVEYTQTYRVYETVLATNEDMAEHHAIQQFATSKQQVSQYEKPTTDSVSVVGITLQE